MIDWTDDAVVLSARPQGETAALVSLLTRTHGRHLGIVPGGQSRSRAGWLQAGQTVQAVWRSRLPEQLGTFTLEPETSYAAPILHDGTALAGLSAACAVADAALAERESHPAIFESLLALLEILPNPSWPYAYVRWELGVLAELGYAVDLSCCAVTGVTEGLTHVSPRTARAVCAEVAAPYVDKLLPLPQFLLGRGDIHPDSLQKGLRLTGFFLERCVFAVHHAPLPVARTRLNERMENVCLTSI